MASLKPDDTIDDVEWAGYQSLSMTKYYSLSICMHSNSFNSGGHVVKWDTPDLFVWQLRILAEIPAWSILSHTSKYISRKSPNQVKRIDLFSIRRRKKEENKKRPTLVVRIFLHRCPRWPLLNSQSHPIPLLFLPFWRSNGKLLSSDLLDCCTGKTSSDNCTFLVVSAYVTMQMTHSAGLLIGSTDTNSRAKWKC